MDIRQLAYIYDREIELIEKKRILKQLDIAECINMAYIGSQAVQKGKTNTNIKMYSRWRRKKVDSLYPETKRSTIWDGIKKSGKIN
jgi:hypothetical protein